MTTNAYADVTRNRSVPTNFNPNSYPMMSEQVPEHENVPYGYNQHFRPAPFYTEPYTNSPPAQPLEPRSNPHAARQVDMFHTDAASSNAPFGSMRTNSVKKDESRWWDWTHTKTEPHRPGTKGHDERTKTGESSYGNAYSFPTEAGVYAKRNSRYSASPHHVRAIGIVPITDLKQDNLASVNQTFVDKVSYEQQYNGRNPANYSLPGKRHDIFTGEDMKSSSNPINRNQSVSSAKVERQASMWDLFHPHDNTRDQIPNNSRKYRQPLPEIKRTEKNDGPWQNAPYAYDFQVDQGFHQPPVMNQINMD